MSANTPEKKRKEVSNEVRMLLAFVLMGLILLGTNYVYKWLGITPASQTQSAQTKTAQTKTAAATPASTTASGAPMSPSGSTSAGTSGSASSSPAPASASPSTTAATPESAKIAASNEQTQTIDTSLYHVVFSNRGGVVKSWVLKNVTDGDGKPLDLVNGVGSAKVAWPFSFAYASDKHPDADLNKALWVAHPEGLTLRFDFADGGVVASKTFAFQQDGYIVRYSDNLTQAGAGVPHQVEWRAGFGDMSVHNAYAAQATVYYDTVANKLKRQGASTAKNGPVNAEGSFSFAGIDDQYFAAVFLPLGKTQLHVTTYDDTAPSPDNSADSAYPGVAVGGAAANNLEMYVGSKEISALHKINPKLEDLIDWGWFGVIAKPFFMILHWLNDSFLHNYGWSIVVLTLFINLAQLPLKFTSMKSMRKMQALQPEMKAINEKYKGVGMNSPKAQEKQQEMMDLYKKHGVNPMGGCVPLLIQLPFLYAFYRVIAVTVELRHAHFLWITDLSQPEHFPIHPLPLIMTVSSYMMQRMTPQQPGVDPNQQKMMQFMPLMYLFIFWYQSSGLVLYWLTNNLIGMAQQWFFNKTLVPVAAGPALQAPPQKVPNRKRA